MTEQHKVRDANRWRRRPVLSFLVRAFAVCGPPAIAFVFSLSFSRIVSAPHGVAATIGWWTLVTALTLVVLFAVERVARKLLPLAALLNLSLLFPDRAPARYKVARSAGRPKDLEARLVRAREQGASQDTMSAQTVLELVAALSVHDRPTRGHSERVRIFADLIADELKLPAEAQDRLRWSALLHDVGKLRVSPSLLNKPGTPTSLEWATLRRHPINGAEFIAPIAPWLGEWAAAVEHHHERFDGTGYPRGLQGTHISLGGRIVAVADAYETMTAARPYKRPISPTAARAELVACSGTHFDPEVVRAFLSISLGRLWRAVGFSALLSQVPLLPQVSYGVTRASSQTIPGVSSGATAIALVTAGGAVTGFAQPDVSPLTHNLSLASVSAPVADQAPAERVHHPDRQTAQAVPVTTPAAAQNSAPTHASAAGHASNTTTASSSSSSSGTGSGGDGGSNGKDKSKDKGGGDGGGGGD